MGEVSSLFVTVAGVSAHSTTGAALLLRTLTVDQVSVPHCTFLWLRPLVLIYCVAQHETATASLGKADYESGVAVMHVGQLRYVPERKQGVVVRNRMVPQSVAIAETLEALIVKRAWNGQLILPYTCQRVPRSREG